MAFSSFSEAFGRKAMYHTSNIVFVVFLVGNAESRTVAQFMTCRFFSGCAGGMPWALGGGTIANLTRPDKRRLATALFSLGPLAGPVSCCWTPPVRPSLLLIPRC
jgi:MFS family permease